MDREFWLKRWREKQIGFHQNGVHADLQRHAGQWIRSPGHQILVPLCGKSHDLAWLVRRGHHVVGVELSELAIEALHEEHNIDAVVTEEAPYNVWRSVSLTVLQGDFFDLDPATHGIFDRAWDRASLVALPPNLRPGYVQKLKHMLSPNAKILLNAFAYDQSKIDGPPFSVPEEDVRALFNDCRVTILNEIEEAPSPRMAELGVPTILTTTYLIEMPPPS